MGEFIGALHVENLAQLEKKGKKLMEIRGCLRCGSGPHWTQNCRANLSACRNCRGNHHGVLCIKEHKNNVGTCRVVVPALLEFPNEGSLSKNFYLSKKILMQGCANKKKMEECNKLIMEQESMGIITRKNNICHL